MGLGQKDTAVKVSMILLFILANLVFFEKLLRRKKRYEGLSNKKIKPIIASKKILIPIYFFLSSIVFLGFILPMYEIIKFTFLRKSYSKNINILSITFNTLIGIAIAILFIIILASIFVSLVNGLKTRKNLFLTLGIIGYSIPSIVLALPIYIFILSLDKFIYNTFNTESFILINTKITLILAFIIKFISIAISNYSNTLAKINPNIFHSSTILGYNFLGTFFRINIPLLKKSSKYVFILLFIDLIKELTLKYSLRPFNFKTLSTEIYRYAGNEMIEVAAIPSLVIVFICTLMIIYLELGGDYAKNRKVKF